MGNHYTKLGNELIVDSILDFRKELSHIWVYQDRTWMFNILLHPTPQKKPQITSQINEWGMSQCDCGFFYIAGYVLGLWTSGPFFRNDSKAIQELLLPFCPLFQLTHVSTTAAMTAHKTCMPHGVIFFSKQLQIVTSIPVEISLVSISN